MTNRPDDGSGTGRLRLLVAYDGGPFQGWQSQAHRDTVQDQLEAAFSALCGGWRVAVHGSGRTDAGVHARGQVAHADVPGRARLPPARWRDALNAHLPPTIRVRRVRFAPPDFHARYSARGKIYRYLIWNAPVLSPFRSGRAWHVPAPLDMTRLQRTAGKLVGTHDFASFAANRGFPAESTVRTIHRIDLRQSGSLLTLDYAGNGFLYKMVRLLTGSLARCAQGRADEGWIDQLLAREVKSSFAAPAEGLYLLRVLYGETDGAH